MLKTSLRTSSWLWLAMLIGLSIAMNSKPLSPARAQETPDAAAPAEEPAAEPSPEPNDVAEKKFDEAMAEEPAADSAPAKPKGAEPPKMSLIDLFFKGGLLMWPILAMSLIALAFAIERALALRRGKIIPTKLVDSLGSLATSPTGLDPRKAYRVCQQYPSAASNVIRAMLLKVGRPHSEVEHAVQQASDREATRLFGNVRPIQLAVTVSPLMGLLGTVQGMIMAFYDTAYAPVGVNKATHLATGIYVALITTFGGLVVAIPAAMIVHYFEGRILSLFRDVDELTQSLLPQLERFEGKLRVSRQQLGAAEESSAAAAPAAESRRQPAATGSS